MTSEQLEQIIAAARRSYYATTTPAQRRAAARALLWEERWHRVAQALRRIAGTFILRRSTCTVCTDMTDPHTAAAHTWGSDL